jgi:steroid delta-isomerase-like uncharacterized protein
MSASETIKKQIEAFNKHDAAAFAGLYAADAVVHDPYYEEPLRGRDAIREDMAAFFRAFPDLENTVLTTLENGRTVATEIQVFGTHKGPLALPAGEIPATGRTLRFGGAILATVNGKGEIAEERRYYDVAGQLQQLGVS